MPEMNRTKPEVVEELDVDFDEEKDDLIEELEEDTPEEDLLEERTQGFFSRIADKIKGFFKDIKEKITSSIQQRVSERKDLHDARVSAAYNKAVMGKKNYENAVVSEYREAHKRGDVNLLAENEGHKPESSRSSVEDMMRGKSAFDEIDNADELDAEKVNAPAEEAPKLYEGVTYDVAVTKVLPENNLVVVEVNGTEGRIHASQLPKDKPIGSYRAGDTFEAVCIQPYNGHPSFSVTKLDEMTKNVEKQVNEDSKDGVVFSDTGENPYGSNLTDEELQDIFFGGKENVATPQPPETPNIFAKGMDKPSEPAAEKEAVSEKQSEIPPEVIGDVTPNPEPVSHTVNGPTNHICYDVNSFVEVTNTSTQQTVTLVGGKGSIELVGTCDGTAWSFKNGNGKKVSDEKATAILSQHKNIGDIEKAMSAHLLAQKEAFDKFKETSDRAESAFEPTVFHYKEKAVVVTHEGKALEVAPMTHSDDVTRQTFDFNKRGIDNAAKTVKATFAKESLDKGDDLVEEEDKEDKYVDIDAATAGYEEQEAGNNSMDSHNRENYNMNNREDVGDDDLGI